MDYLFIIYVYLIGGITFIPTLLVLILIGLYYSSPKYKRHSIEEEVKSEKGEKPNDNVKNVKSGWLHVRRDFVKDPQLTLEESYTSIIMNGYKSLVEHKNLNQKIQKPKVPNLFWSILKNRTLYLYKDKSCDEIIIAINLDSINVTIHPSDLTDAELFTKRTAIRLDIDENCGISFDKIDETRSSESDDNLDVTNKSKPFFIHALSLIELEDWYHELMIASDLDSNPIEHPSPAFIISDMERLVNNIDNEPDPIPTRWLNALIGRYFFSIYRTQWLEDWIIGRIMKKLKQVKRPKFLTNIMVTEANLGNMPPNFSKPILKELTKEGDSSVEVHVSFKGCVTIKFQATATLNFGNKLKSYSVDLLLAVVLRSLEGNLLIKMKKPPSNRIWYGFTTMPEMKLDVEPVVEDRKVKWGMITSAIENKLREIIQEGLVLPSMDDIAYFDTTTSYHRGGIYSDNTRTDFHQLPQNRTKTMKERERVNVENNKESIAPEALDFNETAQSPKLVNEAAAADDVRSTTSSHTTASSKTKNWFNDKFTNNNNQHHTSNWFEKLQNHHNQQHHQSSLADGSASFVSSKHLNNDYDKIKTKLNVDESESKYLNTMTPSPKSTKTDRPKSVFSENSDKLSVASDDKRSIKSYSTVSSNDDDSTTSSSVKDKLKTSPTMLHAKDALKKLQKNRSSKKTKKNGGDSSSASSIKSKVNKEHHDEIKAENNNKGEDSRPKKGKGNENINQRMEISRSQPTVGLNIKNELEDEIKNNSENKDRDSNVLHNSPPKPSPMMTIPRVPIENKEQIQNISYSPPQQQSNNRSGYNIFRRSSTSIGSIGSIGSIEMGEDSSKTSSMGSNNSKSEALLQKIKNKDRENREIKEDEE